ncbi:MAG: glycosyltransferase [Rhodobiaceae bacterium]|nr:glycosyltransferase [Rhodobiaceae bacterium]MCC0012063.1 glycosyltransferase [Rhodobiaceae bacterium]MCC0061021.1 glycosyltransferase [Rhodobiaceae bacterium]
MTEHPTGARLWATKEPAAASLAPARRRFAFLPPSISVDPNAHEHPGRARIRSFLYVAFVLTAAAYFGWRLTVFNPDAPVYSAFFYLAEIFGVSVGVMISFIGTRCIAPKALQAPTDLSVDVFVTTYDEPVEVVRSTLLGVNAMTYPHISWLLDDGNRAEMRALAQELGVRYLAREKNTGAKAGNLNNALKHAAGDFVAVFDADHVPQKDFLDRLLGYFTDAQVGFVQTPQDYYNPDGFQYMRGRFHRLICHDQSQFHYVGQTGRNSFLAATFCGCSAVLRRSALDMIGGFPEETVTEDMHCAVRMQKKGFSGLYHPEPLAFGIAPVRYREYLRQRLRWGQGNLQVCRAEGLPFSRDLSAGQQFCYMALVWPFCGAVAKMFLYVAPVVLLIAGVAPIISEPEVFAAVFLPYLVCSLLLNDEIVRGYGNFWQAEVSFMSQLGSGLVSLRGLFRRNLRFDVSSKLLHGGGDWPLLLPQLLVLGLSLVAVCVGASRVLTDSEHALPLWLFSFVAAIAVFNIALALRVIANVRRVSRLHEDAYRHPVGLPVQVSMPNGTVQVVATQWISTRDARIGFGESAHAPRIGETLRLKIYLPRLALDVSARVTGRDAGAGNGADIVFDWDSMRDRDRLDLALHGSRWHRVPARRHERMRTPYDVFYDLLVFGRLSRGEETPLTPVLIEPASREDGPEAAFTGHLPIGGNPVQVLLAFTALGTGPVSFTSTADGSIGKLHVVSEIIDPAISDWAAMNAVGGRLYSVGDG